MEDIAVRTAIPEPLLPALLDYVKRHTTGDPAHRSCGAYRAERILRETLGRVPMIQDLLSPVVLRALRSSTSQTQWIVFYRPLIRGAVYGWLENLGVAPAFVPGMEDWLGMLGYSLHRPVRCPKDHHDPVEVVRFAEHLALASPQADHERILRGVRAFLAWCEGNRGAGLDRLTATDMHAWLAHLRNPAPDAPALSPRSVSNNVTLVRRFLKYAEDRGICAAGLRDAIPPCWVDTPTNRRALDGTECRRLLAGAARDKFDPLLWVTLLAVHFDTAGRPKELLKLLCEHVTEQDGACIVTLHGGKRRNPSGVEISSSSGAIVARYISVRPLRRGSPFFRHRNGEPVGYQNYKDHFQAWLQLGEAGRGVGPHAIRHTVLTWMDGAGEGISSIRGLSGHRSARGLEPYLHPDRAAVHRAVAEAMRTLEERQ